MRVRSIDSFFGIPFAFYFYRATLLDSIGYRGKINDFSRKERKFSLSYNLIEQKLEYIVRCRAMICGFQFFFCNIYR